MSSGEGGLDVRKIRNLIEEGCKAIPDDKYYSQAIIVLGDTGVGKSTLLNLLKEVPLKVKKEGLKVSLHAQAFNRVKIGHAKVSETFLPARLSIKRLAFYDCPGFSDNKGDEYELANSFFLQRLLTVYERVKLLLVVDESHISEPRADKLPRMLKTLTRFFGGYGSFRQGCCMVVSRADPENKREDYEREIMELVADSRKMKLFSTEDLQFLEYLASNQKILLFREPPNTDIEIYQPGEEQMKIMPAL